MRGGSGIPFFQVQRYRTVNYAWFPGLLLKTARITGMPGKTPQSTGIPEGKSLYRAFINGLNGI